MSSNAAHILSSVKDRAGDLIVRRIGSRAWFSLWGHITNNIEYRVGNRVADCIRTRLSDA